MIKLSKQKKNSDKELAKILVITALLNAITGLIDLIKSIIK